MRQLGLWITAVLVVATACSKEDPGSKPVDGKRWREKHKVALDAFSAKLAAAVTLIKDLPAANVNVAEPAVPFQLRFTTGGSDNPNAVLVSGVDVPGLPEYGQDKDKDLQGGDMTVSVNYMGFIEWFTLNSLLETGKPKYDTKVYEADSLVKKLETLRFLVIYRELASTRGIIDTAKKTFTPGTYRGVAHVVDLEGPKHLGSVTYSAENTGSFESFSGSEAYMLRADLQHATMRAFAAEWRKTFPKLAIQEPPRKEEKK